MIKILIRRLQCIFPLFEVYLVLTRQTIYYLAPLNGSDWTSCVALGMFYSQQLYMVRVCLFEYLYCLFLAPIV